MKKKEMKKVKGQGNVAMSLYEINQNIISQLPPYEIQAEEELMEKISAWNTNHATHISYYMLLNNDKHYYTIFHYKDSTQDFTSLGKGVIALLKEMGYAIVADEILEDHCEIWVKNETETIAYLLFPYDEGVVTYG